MAIPQSKIKDFCRKFIVIATQYHITRFAHPLHKGAFGGAGVSP